VDVDIILSPAVDVVRVEEDVTSSNKPCKYIFQATFIVEIFDTRTHTPV
jgi:hypothetical protein